MGKTYRRVGVENKKGRYTRQEALSGKTGLADALFHSDKYKRHHELTRNPNKEPLLVDEVEL